MRDLLGLGLHASARPSVRTRYRIAPRRFGQERPSFSASRPRACRGIPSGGLAGSSRRDLSGSRCRVVTRLVSRTRPDVRAAGVRTRAGPGLRLVCRFCRRFSLLPGWIANTGIRRRASHGRRRVGHPAVIRAASESQRAQTVATVVATAERRRFALVAVTNSGRTVATDAPHHRKPHPAHPLRNQPRHHIAAGQHTGTVASPPRSLGRRLRKAGVDASARATADRVKAMERAHGDQQGPRTGGRRFAHAVCARFGGAIITTM